MTNERHGFTERQWEVLKSGPAHMLVQVAGADSHIDRAEWQALIESVGAAADQDDALVRDVMRSVSDELVGERPIGQHDGFDGIAGLKAVALVLDSLPDRGRGLREALMRVGATIADSSGAQLTRTFAAHHNSPGWTRSGGTSAVESAALRAALVALDLD